MLENVSLERRELLFVRVCLANGGEQLRSNRMKFERWHASVSANLAE